MLVLRLELETCETYRLVVYTLFPARSCDGEPAPERVLPAMLPKELRPGGGFGKSGLPLEPLGGSIGEVFPVEEPERGFRSSDGDA